MDDRPIRRGVWFAVLGMLATLGILLVYLSYRDAVPKPASPQAAHAPATASVRTNAPSRPDLSTGGHPAPREPEPVPYIEGELYGDLDLGEVRAALPDNLYWEWGSPTKDPEVLEKRAQEKERRNQEYVRVLAGDANEDEVRAYYGYRERLSSDYLEFADYVKRRFGDKISEQFNGLLDTAIRLNKARLAQIPADREDAIERSREHAKIREQWQREQAEFEAAQRKSSAD